MYTLHRRQINGLILILLASLNLSAQRNLEQFDLKRIRFGFTIAANSGRMLVDMKNDKLPYDTLMNVSVKNFPGIGLGGIMNIRLAEYWDLRMMVPVISFVQRNLVYDFPNSSKEVKIESAYCDASFLVKYKSERRKNTRIYVIGGGRVSYDFASSVNKSRSVNNPIVSLNTTTYGWEAGFGLDLYFPYFKLSPELKLCSTFSNAMYRDGYIYTNYIQSLRPQMIQLSFHFE